MANQRKSQEEKELMGTARKDRVGADSVDPVLVDNLPEFPSFLNKVGRKHWKKCTKLLQNAAILAETDLDSLGFYCMHLQIAEKAAETLKDELFHPSVNENGETYYMGMTAVLKIFNEASSAAMKFAQQFGFTPVARKNVPAPKKSGPKSRLQEMKDRRNRDERENIFKVA